MTIEGSRSHDSALSEPPPVGKMAAPSLMLKALVTYQVTGAVKDVADTDDESTSDNSEHKPQLQSRNVAKTMPDTNARLSTYGGSQCRGKSLCGADS